MRASALGDLQLVAAHIDSGTIINRYCVLNTGFAEAISTSAIVNTTSLVFRVNDVTGVLIDGPDNDLNSSSWFAYAKSLQNHFSKSL